MALFQLLYISDAKDVNDLDDLLEIQHASIRNNARQNITGILFHSEGRFVQLLEGEHGDIHALFEKICRDDRHENVRLIYERPVRQRVFDEWHMAMLDLDLHDDAERADLKDLIHHAKQSSELNGQEPADLPVLNRFRELLLTA